MHIECAYTRYYSDNGQTWAHVEWSDGSRSVGPTDNDHMLQLLARTKREGLTIHHESW
jgi:hypothetical protein